MEISPEVTSAIITFLGTCLLGITTFYITTHRGSKVILRKIRESSLVKWSTIVNDKLSFTYNGKPIERLKLYEFDLTNEGYIDIENFEVTLDFEAEDKNPIIEIQVNDKQDKVNTTDILEFYSYIINRPYLNMVKKYKDERLGIQIFTNTNLKIIVSGGGKGWGVVYKESNIPKFYKYMVFFPIVFSLVLVIAYFIIDSEISTFVITGGAMLVTIVFTFLSIKYEKNIRAKI